MIRILKEIFGSSSFLKKLLLPVYIGGGSMIYWIYKKFNVTIFYRLADKTKVKFYPKGQIAKGIFLGGFETKELEILQSFLHPGSVMIDAGANIGLYSIIGSRLVGATGKIYSFEPSKPNYDLFLKNIELNKIKNIVPVNKGLGDTIGESLLVFQDVKSDAEKYILKKDQEITNCHEELSNGHSHESISLDTLDNFQSKNNINKIDFIKIDVEGYEYFVFKGGENLLKINPGVIILFECAEHLAKRAGSTPGAVFSFLHNLGFELVYWNEKEKQWSTNLNEALKYGQLVGGRNIMAALNN